MALDVMELVSGVEEWIAQLHQSASSHPMPHPFSVLHKATKSNQPIHIHPEDGNYNAS
jgi:hypothetical protein